MEVRIGIKHAPRELSFETEQTKSDLEKIVATAISAEERLVSFTDSKNRTYLVATENILYLELSGDQARRVGFIA